MTRIEFKIGDDIRDVERRSGMSFGLDQMTDMSPKIIDSPATVVYLGLKARLELPETRYVWISQAAGMIVELETSPQLGSLDLEGADRLGSRLVDLLRQAGWREVARFETNIKAIREELELPDRSKRYLKLFGEWADGPTLMRMSLKETGWTLPGRPDPPQFVVNCEFRNPRINDHAMKAVLQKRKAHGNPNEALPLTAWFDGGL